ncbi:MAG: hypothetical protein JWR51_4599 [Devosia sp.]|nr:hypothetical protein [Devosia sp.]
MEGAETLRLGLALSGGGTRAACFHLGLLLRLARQGLLENVSAVSTVSGGSLAIAAVFSENGNRWPSSVEYEQTVYPALRTKFTKTDLFSIAALVSPRSLIRYNARLINRRAHILADRLRTVWGITGKLADLPATPKWWINAASIRSGKNWRFSKGEMGDWKFGRHYSPDVLIADAAAASAAVPYAIGALHLPVPAGGWYQTDPATGKPVQSVTQTLTTLPIWDGGAYDNLGLEVLVKVGRQSPDWDFLICSDASGVLGPPARGFLANLLRGNLVTPRLFDLMGDQVRSLRSRMLMREFSRGEVRGLIVRMGNSVRDIDLKSGRVRQHDEYHRFQTDQEASVAVAHPTALNRLSPLEFERIVRHGFEVSDASLAAHAGSEFDQSFMWDAA